MTEHGWIHINRRGSGRPDAVILVTIQHDATLQDVVATALRATFQHLTNDQGLRVCTLCGDRLIDGHPEETWAEDPVHIECHDIALAALDDDLADDDEEVRDDLA